MNGPGRGIEREEVFHAGKEMAEATDKSLRYLQANTETTFLWG